MADEKDRAALGLSDATAAPPRTGDSILTYNPWRDFKIQLAKMVVVSTILYGVTVSIAFLFWGAAAAKDQLLWQFITTTVSTMMGWMMSKASTIIDHQFGTSAASDHKTQFLMDEVKNKEKGG